MILIFRDTPFSQDHNAACFTPQIFITIVLGEIGNNGYVKFWGQTRWIMVYAKMVNGYHFFPLGTTAFVLCSKYEEMKWLALASRACVNSETNKETNKRGNFMGKKLAFSPQNSLFSGFWCHNIHISFVLESPRAATPPLRITMRMWVYMHGRPKVFKLYLKNLDNLSCVTS